VGNEENEYLVPNTNKTIINVTKEPIDICKKKKKKKNKEEILEEITEKFMEKVLDVVNWNL
jgi:hypothetical protein